MSKKEHATPTEELVVKMVSTTNPVTRAVYREMIANRLGITEANEFKEKQEHRRTHRFMTGLTYSFESRSKMERFFHE